MEGKSLSFEKIYALDSGKIPVVFIEQLITRQHDRAGRSVVHGDKNRELKTSTWFRWDAPRRDALRQFSNSVPLLEVQMICTNSIGYCQAGVNTTMLMHSRQKLFQDRRIRILKKLVYKHPLVLGYLFAFTVFLNTLSESSGSSLKFGDVNTKVESK